MGRVMVALAMVVAGVAPAVVPGVGEGEPTSDPLVGRVVALDPGHGGGAGEGRLVPDGRGGRKACNASGTSTASGYPEHAFTWDVAKRTARALRKEGIVVAMTRAKDPLTKAVCVDQRGRFPQEVGADLAVSIHGDGNTNPAVKGYFALVSDPPLHEAHGAPSRELARRILRQLGREGFTRNTAFGQGLSRRRDLAGLNFAQVPSVMVELGEMRNPEEGRVMASARGRQRYARALARAIINYLNAHP